jgi:class 3 adenylate cyclase
MDSACYSGNTECDKGECDWLHLMPFDDRRKGEPVSVVFDVTSRVPTRLKLLDEASNLATPTSRVTNAEDPIWVYPYYQKLRYPDVEPSRIRTIRYPSYETRRVPVEVSVRIGLDGEVGGRVHNQKATVGIIVPAKQLSVMQKTVLELDMVGYSTVARILDQNAGADTVSKLNREIQGFVDVGLTSIGAKRNEVVMATTGDGAILVFAEAEQAHRFAAAVHRAAHDHSVSKNEPSAKRVFRMGCATGDIAIHPREEGGFDIAGVKIADAVRLESNSLPGSLLIDSETYAKLPPDLQKEYQGPQTIRGKRDETYEAWSCTMDPHADAQRSEPTVTPLEEPTVNRGEFEEAFNVLDFMEQMETLCGTEGAILRLVLAMEMPAPVRPPESRNCGERCAMIFDWAKSHKQEEKLKIVVQKLLVKYGY